MKTTPDIDKKMQWLNISAIGLVVLVLIFSKINFSGLQQAGVISAPVEIVGDDVLSGQLEVFIKDDFENPENSVNQYFINDGQNKIPFIFDEQDISTVNSFLGKNIKVKGSYTGKSFAGKIEGNQSNKQSANNPPIINTNHKVITFLLKAEGVKKSPFSKSDAKKIIFNEQFAKFMSEQSYGKISFSGDVYGWIPVALQSSSSPVINLSQSEISSYIASNNIDLAKYDHVLFIYNCAAGCKGGNSTVGKINTTVNGQVYNVSVTTISGSQGNNGKYDFLSPYYQTNIPTSFQWRNIDAYLAHEFGHALGLMHANAHDCGNVSVFAPSGCGYIEYGNVIDTMGFNKGSGLQFNAFFKYLLGWINPSDIVQVNSSGTYTLSPLEIASGTKMLRINQPALPGISYNVEFRQPIGFDKDIGLNKDGILIYRVINGPSMQYDDAKLIDASPTPSPWFSDTNPASLSLSGQGVFKDDRRGIKIGPLTMGSNGEINVAVDISSPATCLQTAPVIGSVFINNSLSYTIPVGAQASISATAFNDATPTCTTSSTFTTSLLINGTSLNFTQNANIASESFGNFFTTFTPTTTGNFVLQVKVTNQANGKITSKNIPIVVQ